MQNSRVIKFQPMGIVGEPKTTGYHNSYY